LLIANAIWSHEEVRNITC